MSRINIFRANVYITITTKYILHSNKVLDCDIYLKYKCALKKVCVTPKHQLHFPLHNVPRNNYTKIDCKHLLLIMEGRNQCLHQVNRAEQWKIGSFAPTERIVNSCFRFSNELKVPYLKDPQY